MSLIDPKKMLKLLAETNSERILICCDDHGYYPDSKLSRGPALGCKYCVMAELYYEFSKVPPEKRQERSEQLEQLVYHMVEEVESGKWDIKIFEHPHVSIENDVDIS
jgi:hypothetical protein